MRWDKTRTSEGRYALYRINSRSYTVEENTSELEDIATQTISVLTVAAAHIIKLEQERKDEQSLCTRMTSKFVKHSIFLKTHKYRVKNGRCQREVSRVGGEWMKQVKEIKM